MQSGKIQKELGPDHPVAGISEFHQVFAERLPDEDMEPQSTDRLIYAYHFDKEPSKAHGIPFKFYLKPVCIMFPSFPSSANHK